MNIYLFISFCLVFVGPLVACMVKAIRGLFVHICLICTSHAIGALLLFVGLRLLKDQSFVGGLILLFLSADFYTGVIFFIYLSLRHSKGTSLIVMHDILRQEPSERIVLKKRKFIWPLLLIPYFKGSHTVFFTGRRFVKDVKFGVGFTDAFLTNKRILVQLIFLKVLIIDILISDITEVKYFDEKKDILEITYTNSKISPLTRLCAFSGTPGIANKLLLNLQDDCSVWIDTLQRRNEGGICIYGK